MFSNNIGKQTLSMPITQEAIRWARQFAFQQQHPQKKEQIYLNTLAVLAVRNYLKILDIETDLTECDSWNSAIRLFEDVADLYVKGLGKIECRPIRGVRQQPENGKESLPDLPSSLIVPIEARQERIGYIAVGIDEEEKQATLLGFSPTADSGELVLNELLSLDDLLIHLEGLSESKINLQQWLVKAFTGDWLSPETVFNLPSEIDRELSKSPIPPKSGNLFKKAVETSKQKFQQGKQNINNLISPHEKLSFAFRSGGRSQSENRLLEDRSNASIFPEADVKRAKLIDFGMRLGKTSVVLLVAIVEEEDRSIKVQVQLHPAIGESYLPENIKLSLISDRGKNLHEVESTIQNRRIVMNDFYAYPDESFQIRISLDDLSITEKFVV
ncbi:MAG: DUF1822 family protein [Microcoleus sp.]